MKSFRFFAFAAIVAAAVSCTSGDYRQYAEGNLKWSLVIEQDSAPFKREVLTCRESEIPERTQDGKDVVLTYDNFCGSDIDVTFRFSPYDDGRGVEIVSNVTNRAKGKYVKGIIGPIYEDESMDLTTWSLITPWGPGRKFSGRPDLKDAEGKPMKKVGEWTLKSDGTYEILAKYPSANQSMQWNEFTGPEGGLYVASHDPEYRFKHFITRFNPGTGKVSYGIEHMMTCFSGESVTTPGTIIWPHKGDWHTAADRYSEFYHANMTFVEKPSWVDESTAWMLTIMKQQNNELMWPYASIGREMTDVAKARGYNMLGLFGWTVGGHDKYYPEYDPDPVMGGEQGLRDGIAEAHERGMKVILYVNGQLIDTEGTKFWGELGEDMVVRNADGSDYHQMWQKYKDFPARHHGMVCQSDPRWKDIMLDLAMQMHSYGADGIIYDQLGTTNITYCYAPNHGHTVPAIVYSQDKADNLKYVEQKMKEVDPDFIVITEGICEYELNSVSMFHHASGKGGNNLFYTEEALNDYIGGSPAGSYFGQMTKYTIPEWTSTNRIQAPVNNRESLNYCILIGMRPEIECRYTPDVLYLEEGRMPRDDDYSNMVSKVDFSMVKSLDVDDAREYSRQVNEFLLANADLFFKGRFLDTTGYGISTASKAVRSSAYLSGERLGIVVWNTSRTESADYSLSVPGYKLEGVVSPEGDATPGSLAPSKLCLAIYSK